MLSVAESARILNVSPARVRTLIAEGALPAQKVGRAWALQQNDVLQRALSKPKPGRPRTSDCPPPEAPPSERIEAERVHELFAACKEAFAVCPTATEIAAAITPEEADFIVAMSDFFLQQRQRELVKRGVF